MHNFRNLEEALYFMLQSLRLSRVDRLFMNKLIQLMQKNNFITSNQDQLLKKIIAKYNKQLAKLKIDYKNLLTLPYKKPIQPSVESKAVIQLLDSIIIVKAPYKPEFIKGLRNDTIPKISWVKEKNRYEMPFTLSSLKKITNLISKSFSVVEYCSKIEKIFTILENYKAIKYWDPTLVLKNNNLIIVAANQHVIEATNHIPLELNLKTLATLTRYSLEIDVSVIEEISKFESLEKIKLASNHTIEVDYDLCPQIFAWLKEFGCDAIYYNQFGRISKLINTEHIKEIKKQNLKIILDESSLSKFLNPAIIIPMHDLNIVASEANIFKKIKWLNSKPIVIK